MNNGILNGLLASNSGFLYGFLTWFKAFFGNMLSGLLSIFKGLFDGIVQIFNFPYYFRLWATEGSSFGALDWILSILAFILAFAVWAGIIFLIVIGIRKLVRLGKTAAKNEDLLEELSDLQSEVNKLTEEKERIIRIKVTQAGLAASCRRRRKIRVLPVAVLRRPRVVENPLRRHTQLRVLQ